VIEEHFEAGANLVVAAFLIYQPGLPLIPPITATDGEHTIQYLLPRGRWGLMGSLLPSIRVLEIL
jgi:hypothetical protein